MASEHVLEIVVRRHLFTSERPFPAVLDGIFGGISQPDIGQLFSKLAASTSYAPVTILIQQTPDGGTRVAYESVAERLDAEVLGLLRQVTGVPASATA